MIRNDVISSNLKSIGYDSASCILEIEFHSGGIYQYLQVSHSVYTDLIEASSLGKFFAYEIKPNFACKQIH